MSFTTTLSKIQVVYNYNKTTLYFFKSFIKTYLVMVE